jgi:hypothetical protein
VRIAAVVLVAAALVRAAALAGATGLGDWTPTAAGWAVIGGVAVIAALTWWAARGDPPLPGDRTGERGPPPEVTVAFGPADPDAVAGDELATPGRERPEPAAHPVDQATFAPVLAWCVIFADEAGMLTSPAVTALIAAIRLLIVGIGSPRTGQHAGSGRRPPACPTVGVGPSGPTGT